MNKLLRHFSFHDWQELTNNESAPCVYVDIDQYYANYQVLSAIALKSQKKIRPATKSIRVPYLIDELKNNNQANFQGLMCYSVSEAHFLFQQGHRDLLVAYPTVSLPDLKLALDILKQGGKITLTADHSEHLLFLSSEWKKISDIKLPICLDCDASLKFLGLHLGVRRSSILNTSDFNERLDEIQRFPELKIAGLLHYEAQIAGLPDRDNEFVVIQKIKELIRKISAPAVLSERLSYLKILKEKKLEISFFNGGGTGSVDCPAHSPLTEITVGSGLFHSHLFDKYSNTHTHPALFISLQTTRLPSRNLITCQSGGFIASGETSANKSPEVYCPKGLKPLSSENFGEVQTPLKITHGEKIKLGDRIIIRPAKAGEIMERFNHIKLVSKGKIIDEVPTYRGLGLSFF